MPGLPSSRLGRMNGPCKPPAGKQAGIQPSPRAGPRTGAAALPAPAQASGTSHRDRLPGAAGYSAAGALRAASALGQRAAGRPED